MTSEGGRTSALHDPEQQLRLFVDGVPDYAVLTSDPAGTVMTWDAGARKIKRLSARLGH
jgi:hypothetical protein